MLLLNQCPHKEEDFCSWTASPCRHALLPWTIADVLVHCVHLSLPAMAGACWLGVAVLKAPPSMTFGTPPLSWEGYLLPQNVGLLSGTWHLIEGKATASCRIFIGSWQVLCWTSKLIHNVSCGQWLPYCEDTQASLWWPPSWKK